MATFPALIPSGRTFTPGEHAGTTLPLYSGNESRISHSNKELNRGLRLSFLGVTTSDLLEIIGHYNGQRGRFLSFDIPDEIFSGMDDPASFTPTGYRWRYVSRPSVSDIPIAGDTPTNRHDVTVELACSPEIASIFVPRVAYRFTPLAPTTTPAPGLPPLLLDLFPGEIGAWSLRHIKTGATVVARVRRSSDNAEADYTPAEIRDGTLLSWVGAGNSGYVTTLYDLSGSGYDMLQTDPARQPRIVNAGALETANGEPALWFNGAGMNLTATVTGLDAAANLSVFAVNQPQNASAPDATTFLIFSLGLGGQDTSNRGLCYSVATGVIAGETLCVFHSSNSFAGNAGRAGSSTHSHTAGQQLNHSVFFLSSGISTWVNGSAITYNLFGNGTSAGSDYSPAASLATGNQLHMGTISGSAGGTPQHIQELIAYPSDETANRTAIESNITAHYS